MRRVVWRIDILSRLYRDEEREKQEKGNLKIGRSYVDGMYLHE